MLRFTAARRVRITITSGSGTVLRRYVRIDDDHVAQTNRRYQRRYAAFDMIAVQITRRDSYRRGL